MPSHPHTTSPCTVLAAGFFVHVPLSAQFVTLQYSFDAQSCPEKSRRHCLPASTPASVTVPDDPLEEVVPLDDDASPLDVEPLDDAVGSPEDPKRPVSLEPPHAMATLAPTKPQQATNQARRIR